MTLAARAVVARYWMLMGTNDFPAIAEVVSADVVVDWPLSHERFRGLEAFVRVNAEYPAAGRWTFTVDRLVGDETHVVSDVLVGDGSVEARAISFFTVRDGMIVAIVEYWPQDYEPPPGRDHLAERTHLPGPLEGRQAGSQEGGVTAAGPELQGSQVMLVPVTAEHVPELRRILLTPEVRFRWGDEAASPQWPFDDVSATRFSIMVDGRVRGMVQYGEEEDPAYRHASIDIFVDPAVHGRGVGRDAVGVLARHLVRSRGHHRLSIDPAADNAPAIRCYAAVGFRPVGLLRRYERDADGDGWHDGLLMDLLAEELDPSL